jgi:hypothetical protein
MAPAPDPIPLGVNGAFEKNLRKMYILWAMIPIFPEFKAIEIEDRDYIRKRLWDYQPETSELNFTNLFIWRKHYGFQWSTSGDWLLVIGANTGNGVAALPPIGPPSRADVTRSLLRWMKEKGNTTEARVDRADGRLVAELKAGGDFEFEPTRDHFDYVYHTTDLIELSGKDYRAKRNHLNHLLRSNRITYEPMDESRIAACLAIADAWCEARRCKEDLNLISEWDATREALTHFKALGTDGGVIIVNGKIEAFTLGELLNSDTGVVHVEKANMDIRGLYAVVNQQFCEKHWVGVPSINREQDLGEPGLRKAKLSYNPYRLVDKFRVTLRT